MKRYWTRWSAVLLNIRVVTKQVDECDIYTGLIKTTMHIVGVHFMGIIHIFSSMLIFNTLVSILV